jgi:hypothetical protein
MSNTKYDNEIHFAALILCDLSNDAKKPINYKEINKNASLHFYKKYGLQLQKNGLNYNSNKIIQKNNIQPRKILLHSSSKKRSGQSFVPFKNFIKSQTLNNIMSLECVLHCIHIYRIWGYVNNNKIIEYIANKYNISIDTIRNYFKYMISQKLI